MGFIQAVIGAIGGTLADQWKDFYTVGSDLPATVGVSPAVRRERDSGRGANLHGSQNVITNGSRIVVPEGTAVVTVQDGAITGIITQPGAYIYSTDDPSSRSIFTGDGLVDSLVKTSWERFQFGGIPATQQLLFYVNLKEIPNNRFGTQSEIYWDDAFLGTQVGAITRGTYSLHIIDPLLFLRSFVPVDFLSPGAAPFDFADMDNPAGEQLFTEVVGCLSAAFAAYTNDPSKGNRMARIQADQIGFAQALGQAVEDAYQWRSGRGLEIARTAILAIEYDQDTRQLMSDVKKADALGGARGASFLQQSVARGLEAAGQTSGGAGMAFMGMGMQAAGGVMGAFPFPTTANQQPVTQASGVVGNPMQADAPAQPASNTQPATGADQASAPTPAATDQAGNPDTAAASPTVTRLIEAKQLLDAGVISTEEFDRLKAQVLGL